MKNARGIAFYLLVLSVGVGFGYLLGTKQQVRKTQDSSSILGRVAFERDGLLAKCEELESEIKDREKLIESLRARNGATGVSEAPAIDSATAPSQGGEPAAALPEQTDPESRPRLFADRYGGALGRLDWKIVGENASRMAELIPEIIAYVAEGKSPPIDKTQEIGQLNRPILMEALKLGEDVPGTGVNGQFTDPAFILNVLTVTLENTEMPLTSTQTEQLVVIAERSMAEDARRRAGYDDSSYELQKLLDEVDLKGRFFDAVFDVLTAEQGSFLSPPLTKDRVRADIFSESMVYVGRLDVFTFTDRDQLKQIVTDRVGRLIGSDETLAGQARGPVERWVDQLPQEDLLAESNSLDRAGMLKAPRITRWGRHVLALLESLVAELSMSDEMAKAIRGLASLTVPLK